MQPMQFQNRLMNCLNTQSRLNKQLRSLPLVIPKVPDMLSRSYQESSSKHEPRLVSQKMMEKVKVKTVCLSRRPSVRLFVKNMAMILLKGQKEWTLCPPLRPLLHAKRWSSQWRPRLLSLSLIVVVVVTCFCQCRVVVVFQSQNM